MRAITLRIPLVETFGLLPNDNGMGSQWHLLNTGQTGGKAGVDLHVRGAWADYSGRGIRIGIVDDGIDPTQTDLAPNIALSGHWDARSNDTLPWSEGTDRHGTSVAGVISADNNGVGLVGIAFDATLYGFRMGFGADGSLAQIASQLGRQVAVDVSNNSWGFTSPFADNFSTGSFADIRDALVKVAAEGRGGLGTNIVFAAGNARASGDNVNYHNMQNAPTTIAVGALDQNGKIAWFSTGGAALLVSAPGVSIATTDRPGAAGYNTAGDTTTVNGTSFAAPMVTGVIALMLEANPRLGYRDVQEILALTASATYADPTSPAWRNNGATNWNGGGLHFSHDAGFGLVDATAAVRLAESWTAQATAANLVTATGSATVNAAIPDGVVSGVTSVITLGADLDIDKVQVGLNILHTWQGDLKVVLISPSGTESLLIDRPGVSSSSYYGSSADNIVFTTSSNAFWGESSAGNWTLRVSDAESGDTGTLVSWTLTALGDASSADDLYVYTDEYGRLAANLDGQRNVLTDAGGTDTINASALTGAAVIDLTGAAGSIAGTAFRVATGTNIESVISGDGDDRLVGNDLPNQINGGRGDDRLDVGAGDDTAIGGAGTDWISGGSGKDRLIGDDGNDWLAGQLDADVLIGGKGDDFMTGGAGNDTIEGGDGNDWLMGNASSEVTPRKSSGNPTFNVSDADRLQGGDGNDAVFGGVGDDTLDGGSGNDWLVGGDGDDSVAGGDGADHLSGNAGNDVLDGGRGDDTLSGGAGDDFFLFSLGSDRADGDIGLDAIRLLGTSADYAMAWSGGNGSVTSLSSGASLSFSGIERLLFDASDIWIA
jgi:subtilisin-like proprotein convertase family protein